jgi:hypothetical protein
MTNECTQQACAAHSPESANVHTCTFDVLCYARILEIWLICAHSKQACAAHSSDGANVCTHVTLTCYAFCSMTVVCAQQARGA